MKSVSQDPPVEIEDAASAPNPDGTSATVANGIGRLIEDHRELDKLFDELDNASGAVATKDLIIRVSRAISAHEDVEASVLGASSGPGSTAAGACRGCSVSATTRQRGCWP